MIKAKTGKPEGSRSRSQIIALFIALIVFIMLPVSYTHLTLPTKA